jgi:hypothetical protein
MPHVQKLVLCYHWTFSEQVSVTLLGLVTFTTPLQPPEVNKTEGGLKFFDRLLILLDAELKL